MSSHLQRYFYTFISYIFFIKLLTLLRQYPPPFERRDETQPEITPCYIHLQYVLTVFCHIFTCTYIFPCIYFIVIFSLLPSRKKNVRDWNLYLPFKYFFTLMSQISCQRMLPKSYAGTTEATDQITCQFLQYIAGHSCLPLSQ